MTGLRRGLLLIAAVLTVLVGFNPSTASAAFTDHADLGVSVGTLRVAAPTNLSTAGSVCTSDGLELHLSWTKSSTDRVASYRVRAYTVFGINLTVGTVGATTSKVVADLGRNSFGYSFTVTTVTSYGWTAESAQTATIRC